MCPIDQCHWDSLGFGMVIAKTSSVRYWFLAGHAKTYHLHVWNQSCPKKKQSWQFRRMNSSCRGPMWLDCIFLTCCRIAWFWGLVPDVIHTTRSLGQFGFWCGHGQNQFSQILFFSRPCKNMPFAGLGPELSPEKAKWTIWEIVQLMPKASVAGLWFFSIFKNSMILMSGASCDPHNKVIGAVLILVWSCPKPVQSNLDFLQAMQKHTICRSGPRAVPPKNTVDNFRNCSAHAAGQCGWMVIF